MKNIRIIFEKFSKLQENRKQQKRIKQFKRKFKKANALRERYRKMLI